MSSETIMAARKMVAEYASTHPAELDWAEDVMLGFTTYTRRKYPNGFYCWAEVDVVYAETGKPFMMDPWPASNYPRAVLLVSLVRAKINHNLAIATQVYKAA